MEMSKEAVRKYLELLDNDEEFLAKVHQTGDDKAAKMALINSYGMEFTKEEFEEVGRECAALFCDENGQLTDQGLEMIAGGLGGQFGGAVGSPSATGFMAMLFGGLPSPGLDFEAMGGLGGASGNMAGSFGPSGPGGSGQSSLGSLGGMAGSTGGFNPALGGGSQGGFGGASGGFGGSRGGAGFLLPF